MELSTESLAGLIRDLRSAGAVGMEKRKQPRVGLRAKVQLEVQGRPGPQGAWVRDVSSGGAGLLMHAPVAEGFTVVLMLPTPSGAVEPLTCIARHCKQVSAGLYAVGVRFFDDVPASRPPAT